VGLLHKERQQSMKKSKGGVGETRVQVAAVPVRHTGEGNLEVLLVTSRTTRRWIVPKGWPIKGLDDNDAAAREAYEEAGVVGRIGKKPVGRYTYWKRLDDHFVLCEVKLYRLAFERQLENWAEQSQRRVHWFSRQDAADLVDEPGLKTLIAGLEPVADRG
jgi:8-oxo-dGTP pyrophosphatase MutT (NUDIX family)